MRPMKLLYFLLLFTTCILSRDTLSQELAEDLERNESQIEVPPIILPNEPNILEIAVKDNDAITENIKAPDQHQRDEVELKERTEILAADDTNKSETNQENLMIPVFSEWTQQQIQEAENKLTNSTEPNKDIKNETLAKHQIVQMRQKNYASPDCGAKVLASNPEAQSTSSVLTDKDEYLLSPCTDRIWFVVELCDSIQAQRVELANFELFSSPLKSVSISVSNRFPTREWTFAGQFDAKSERDVQVLELSSTLFGKFARVDLTYTNTEHYCPLSFFRVFGTSEIEAFEVENEPTSESNSLDDEDEFEHHAKDKVQHTNKDNLLNRAGAAVMSIVHKAAEVLAKSNDNGRKLNETSDKSFQRNCVSTSHNILCQHCSSTERVELDDLISCKSFSLSSLLGSSNEIRNHLVNSVTCHNILGFNLKSNELGTNRSFLVSILPRKYIAAMCNLVATDQKAIPLRIEDISSGINSNLISRKDEVSLKNVSKKEAPAEEDPLCKQEFYPPTEAPVLNLTSNEKSSVDNIQPVEKSEEPRANSSLTGDELNIFNVVEQQKQQDASSTDSQLPAQAETNENPEELKAEHISKDHVTPHEKHETITDPSQPPSTVPSESSEVVEIPAEGKVVQQEAKAPQPEQKQEQAEIKMNGDIRASSPPESVFLRLSNRIKTLEKNMTLSTQYLEELSRRYKKQIEELQLSFTKLQGSVEDQSIKKRENDKKDGDDRRRVSDKVSELNQKMEYLEVILIILSAFFTVQTILVIALFKRVSMLRKTFAAHQLIQRTVAPPSPTLVIQEKGRSTGRKRSKQRTRKISAPNILTQRSPTKSEFSHTTPVLSRTVSAPNKFSAMPLTDDSENYDEMKAMLEENDDILIPGFEELKLNDDVSIQSNDLDTASTVSAVSSNEKHEKSASNKSFKFKRRLSSPFQLKKSSMKKASSDKTIEQLWPKKAMSESPPRIINENLNEIHKSKSFQEDDESSVKFKKSNSFKKLFKKLF